MALLGDQLGIRWNHPRAGPLKDGSGQLGIINIIDLVEAFNDFSFSFWV